MQKIPKLLLAQLTCFLILILPGCGYGPPNIWSNNIINTNQQASFHALNAKVIEALKGNRFKLMQYHLSQDLMNDQQTMATVEHISTRMKDDEFVLQNEYYVVSEPGTNILIGDHNRGINSFEIKLKSTQREMYLAYFVQPHIANKWMVAAVYAKFDYGWKIDGLYLNPYSLDGKTGPELFLQARQQYDKGYLIDAQNTAALARACGNPGQLWSYLSEKPLDRLYSQIRKQVNNTYHFPFAIASVPTHPKVIGVYNRCTPDGQFPVIYYLSAINLKDTVALKKENAAIEQVIGKIMPGMDTGKKYVMYAAYNKMPDPKIAVDHFDMVTKLP